MKSNKKGCGAVSTVLAVLMLIAIVIIAALVVYAWTMGYIGVSTEAAGQGISIPSAANDPTDTDLVVYVKNVGEGTVQLKEDECLYVNGNIALCSITGVTVWGGLATLDEGETATLTFAGGAALPEEKVDIKVTTVSSKSAEYSCYPAASTYNPPALTYFTFSVVYSPQTSSSPFTVTIRALDQYGDLFAGYSGVNNLTCSGGEVTPTVTGSFSNGVWTGEVTVTGASTNATITTVAQSNPSKKGTSNSFVLNAALNTWIQTYGGAGNDRAWAVIETSDGGYAVAGETTSFGAGDYDFWLVKIDASGNMEWNKTYGGAGHEEAHSVVETVDGGYALAGYTDSFGAGDYDFWLVKTDENGTMEWNKTYGDSGRDRAFSLLVNSDGGYLISGINLSVRTDIYGDMLWNKTYGGNIFASTNTTDGCYALAGIKLNCFWLAKAAATGELLWNRTYGVGGNFAFAYTVVETTDGGYALAGESMSGGSNFWLVKTNSDGYMEWNQTYAAVGWSVARALVKTSDGGYAIAGHKNWISTGDDVWLVKTDADGDMEWEQTFAGGGTDYAYALVATSDGGYLIAGSTESYGAGESDFWLIKTD